MIVEVGELYVFVVGVDVVVGVCDDCLWWCDVGVVGC